MRDKGGRLETQLYATLVTILSSYIRSFGYWNHIPRVNKQMELLSGMHGAVYDTIVVICLNVLHHFTINNIIVL